MKITLPNDNFGVTIMLIAILLIATVPFVTVLWFMLKIAPWWAALPVSVASSFITLLLTTVRLRS